MISQARTPQWPKAHPSSAGALGHVRRFEPVEHDPFAPLAHVAAEGRRGDRILGHLAPKDVVVPHELQTPTVKRLLKLILGPQLARFTVGNPANSVNPKTGLVEFEDGGGGGDAGGGEGGAGSGDGGGAGGASAGNGPGGGGSEGPGPQITPAPAPKPAPAPAPAPVQSGAPTSPTSSWGHGGPWSAGGAPAFGVVPGGGVLPGNGTPPGQPIPASITSALSAASGNPLGVTTPVAAPASTPVATTTPAAAANWASVPGMTDQVLLPANFGGLFPGG